MPLKERESSKHVIECLKEIGIDVSGNVIKRLTPEMVTDADKIFFMANPNTAPDFLRNSEKMVCWDIEDPDGQTVEAHRETRDEIRRLIKTMIGNSMK